VDIKMEYAVGGTAGMAGNPAPIPPDGVRFALAVPEGLRQGSHPQMARPASGIRMPQVCGK